MGNNPIQVEHAPEEARLDELGVTDWPIWSCQPSTFPWTYDTHETCYLLEGEVTVTPEDGKPVTIGKGDLVTFPQGLSCTWEVREGVRKHYKLF